jgi:transposase-like protein
MSKEPSSRRHRAQKLFYTEVFKQKIVNEVLSGKLTQRQAQMIYGIRGNATILYWIRQSQGKPGYEKQKPRLANFGDVKKDIAHKKLEEENKELKDLLRVAELRADLWQHAIEVAEQKFGIGILKKYGAQPSTASISKGPKKK